MGIASLTPIISCRIFCSIALFCAGTFGLATAVPARAACQLGVVAAFPLHIQGNRALVDVTLNGGAARLLVDTGAASTMIGRPAAARLGLKITSLEDDRYRFMGVGGEDIASQTRVHDFKLGDTTMNDLRLIVSGPGLKSDDYVGLLGEDILGNYDLELDFPHNLMRLIRPKDCIGDQVAYWAKSYSVAPLAPSYTGRDLQLFVFLNGRRTLAMLDTGAYATTATLAAAADAGVLHSQDMREAGQAGGIGSRSEQNYVVMFDSIVIGDESIKSQRLFVADLFRRDKQVQLGSRIAQSNADIPGMLLGFDFVNAHRIYIARSQRKIYFSYEGGPVFAADSLTKEHNAAPDAQPATKP